MRRVLWLREVSPQEKSLVFSQFKDALTFVAKALDVSPLPWRPPMSGPRCKLADFMACAFCMAFQSDQSGAAACWFDLRAAFCSRRPTCCWHSASCIVCMHEECIP